MGNFFDPEKWVTRGRLKRHVEPLLLLGGGICSFRGICPRKCPPFWRILRIPAYFEKLGTWVTSHRSLGTWVTFSAKSGYPHFLR